MRGLAGTVLAHRGADCRNCKTHLKRGDPCIRVEASKGYGVACSDCVLQATEDIKRMLGEK